MGEFSESDGIFRLLELTSVDPAFGYLAVCQMKTVDWTAIECAG